MFRTAHLQLNTVTLSFSELDTCSSHRISIRSQDEANHEFQLPPPHGRSALYLSALKYQGLCVTVKVRLSHRGQSYTRRSPNIMEMPRNIRSSQPQRSDSHYHEHFINIALDVLCLCIAANSHAS